MRVKATVCSANVLVRGNAFQRCNFKSVPLNRFLSDCEILSVINIESLESVMLGWPSQSVMPIFFPSLPISRRPFSQRLMARKIFLLDHFSGKVVLCRA